MRIRLSSADLALQFTISGGVDGGKRRASGGQGLGIGDTAGGTKDAQELVAFAADAAKQAKLLENHGPGNQRKKKEKQENAASDPSGLPNNLEEIGRQDRCEQKNNGPLNENEIFSGRKKRSIRLQRVQPIKIRKFLILLLIEKQ